MDVEAEIISVGESEYTGYEYTEDAVQNLFDTAVPKVDDNSLFVFLGNLGLEEVETGIPLGHERLVGFVEEIKLEDGSLKGEVTFLSEETNDSIRAVKDLLNNGVSLELCPTLQSTSEETSDGDKIVGDDAELLYLFFDTPHHPEIPYRKNTNIAVEATTDDY